MHRAVWVRRRAPPCKRPATLRMRPARGHEGPHHGRHAPMHLVKAPRHFSSSSSSSQDSPVLHPRMPSAPASSWRWGRRGFGSVGAAPPRGILTWTLAHAAARPGANSELMLPSSLTRWGCWGRERLGDSQGVSAPDVFRFVVVDAVALRPPAVPRARHGPAEPFHAERRYLAPPLSTLLRTERAGSDPASIPSPQRRQDTAEREPSAVWLFHSVLASLWPGRSIFAGTRVLLNATYAPTL